MIKRSAYQLKAGNLKNLKIVDDELAVPGVGEVQVKIKAIGLNFADIFAIWGLYSATPKDAFIPGLEYAGIVHAIGSKVNNHRVGDRVMGITKFGAYSTAINIDHRYVIPMPDNWGFSEGASFLVQVLTAYYGLFNLGNLEPNQTVLIHSGAGGVGIFANRLAKSLRAFTIGTTGSSAKIDFMRKEGYDQVIVRDHSFAQKLSEALADRPLNLVMECIGGKILQQGFDKLAPEGRMIVYGSAQYASVGNRPNYIKLIWKYLTRPKIDPLVLPNRNCSLLGFNLIWLYEQVDKMHSLLESISDHDIGKPVVGHIFPFKELPDAIRLLQSGKTKGKVIIMTDTA